MGRPIKPSLVGKPTDYTDGRSVIIFEKAWIPGASAISTKPVYIIKQTGATRYLVSDGDVTGQIYLSDAVTEAGQGIVTISSGSSTFNVSKILLHIVSVYQDKQLAWSFDGENKISSMNATEYTTAITPVTPPVTPPVASPTGTTTPTTGESGDTGTTGTNTSSDTTGAGSVGD